MLIAMDKEIASKRACPVAIRSFVDLVYSTGKRRTLRRILCMSSRFKFEPIVMRHVIAPRSGDIDVVGELVHSRLV